VPVVLLDPGVDAGWDMGAPWARRLWRTVLQVCDDLRQGETNGYERPSQDNGDQMNQIACIWCFEASAETCNGVEEENCAVEEAIAAE